MLSRPSLLAAIHAKLPIVAACREALAFEESYDNGDGPRRCWVTLLPFSQTGSWIDFVYGYVSLEGAKDTAEDAPEAVAEEPDIAEDLPEPEGVVEEPAEAEAAEPCQVELEPNDEEPKAAESSSQVVPMIPEDELEPEVEFEPQAEIEPEPEAEPEPKAELVEEEFVRL